MGDMEDRLENVMDNVVDEVTAKLAKTDEETAKHLKEHAMGVVDNHLPDTRPLYQVYDKIMLAMDKLDDSEKRNFAPVKKVRNITASLITN